MRIERIFIYTSRDGLPFLRCCVASIRFFYPAIPISLIKNEDKGPFDTSEIETHCEVDVLETGLRQFDWDCGKIEPLVMGERQRCLILDDDTVFYGKVLEALEPYDEDFIINCWDRPDQVEDFWFKLEHLRVFDPGFTLTDQIFNAGQFVATTGLLSRAEFEPLVTFTVPQRPLHPDIFLAGAQGILNYVILKNYQEGRISLRRAGLMRWPPLVDPARIDLSRLHEVPSPVILHWAGPKSARFKCMPLAHVLEHFETLYYSGIPRGKLIRCRRWLAHHLSGWFSRYRKLHKLAEIIIPPWLQRHRG